MPPPPGYRWGFRRPAIREAVRNGADTVQAIAEHLGLSTFTAYAHLRRMERDGQATSHRPYGERAARWRVR